MRDFKPIAILDANVIVSLITCMDAALHSEQPDWSVDSANARADRVKARQALILSLHLHELGATTLSMWEGLRIVMTEVSPTKGTDPIVHFTVIWAQYVREQLTPNWVMGDPSFERGDPIPDGRLIELVEKLWADEPAKNQADQLHVDKAKQYGVPLITFEGLRDDGTVNPKSGIRKRAATAGVTVMTPAEFYAGRDEQLTCERFINAFRHRANAWVQKTSNPEALARAVERSGGYYQYILFGVVDGRSEPVPVTF